MATDSRRGRTALAVIISPLAGPATVWAGSIIRAAIAGQGSIGYSHPIISTVILLLPFEVLGAPAAYGGTLLVVWPVSQWLRARERLSWWGVSGAAAVAGGLLFPMYLHLLDPHMAFDFFPGAGAAAGAATGAVFWFISARR